MNGAAWLLPLRVAGPAADHPAGRESRHGITGAMSVAAIAASSLYNSALFGE
jgi:hypothetical protein